MSLYFWSAKGKNLMEIPEAARSYFPHMLPEETKVWRRFLDKYEKFFSNFRYDVKVGRGVEISNGDNSAYAENMRELTRKRIDVVATREGKTCILEVRPLATAEILGKVEGYAILYRMQMPGSPEVTPVVVCERISRDDNDIANSKGIVVYVV